MTEADVITLLRDAIWLTAKISAPVLLTGMLVGLVVSIVQTTTSIQEQTLTFVPKLIAIGATLVISLGWMIKNLTDFTINLIKIISRL